DRQKVNMADENIPSNHSHLEQATNKYIFSIVIPVLNEADQINVTIEHLCNENTERNYEIIVVDGDQQGSSINAIRNKSVKAITSQQGRGRQMNAGAAIACGEILVFLHADTRLPEMALEKIYDVLQSKKYVGGAFNLGIDSNRYFLKYIEFRVWLRCHVNRIPYGDQGIFLRREYFERIGRFKEIPLMEDVELMRRIRRRGDKIRILPDKVKTSARRWEAEGIIYTTFRNQIIKILFNLGVSPDKLVKYYKTGNNKQKR
ncbi:MAG: TIGR04283 family arsenosugar biosynthesis glycosyltransferase, partial [Planctomycetota bacterium]